MKKDRKDRSAQDKKALELKMMRLRLLSQEELGEVAGGACTLASCNASCGAISLAC